MSTAVAVAVAISFLGVWLNLQAPLIGALISGGSWVAGWARGYREGEDAPTAVEDIIDAASQRVFDDLMREASTRDAAQRVRA